MYETAWLSKTHPPSILDSAIHWYRANSGKAPRSRAQTAKRPRREEEGSRCGAGVRQLFL